MLRYCLAAAIAFVGQNACAEDTYDIQTILSITGGASFLGQGHKQSLDALAEVINKQGGINGRPVRFVYHDDQSNPQVAVQVANEIIAGKPPVILGPALNATCSAVAPLIKTGPVVYCLSPAVHPAPGSFVFSASNDAFDQTAAGLRYFRMKGWTKIATLDGTDAPGQSNIRDVDRAMSLPENAGVKLVARERFNPTDLSMAAQFERIRASGAQAIVIGATGAVGGTILRNMTQADLELPVSLSSGTQSVAQLEQWKGFLPRTLVLTSAPFPEHEGVAQLDTRVESAQRDMYRIFRDRHIDIDNMVSTSWDAGLIVIAALRASATAPTPEGVRAFIAGLTGFAGINGLYDFKANPERGLGKDSAIIVRYDAEKRGWTWLTKLGGEPLSP